jgi:hypothetical protein
MERERVKSFLAELTRLTRKHRIKICGCGNCKSPFLTDLEVEQLSGKYSIDDDCKTGLIFEEKK